MREGYIITYWNSEGKYQKEYKIIYDMFIRNTQRGEERETDNLYITSKIKRIAKLSKKIYRYYNDGDTFVYKGIRIKFDYPTKEMNNALRSIESDFDDLIKEVWNYLIMVCPQKLVIQTLK